METPATGMWGIPSDYPADFVTIDVLVSQIYPAFHGGTTELEKVLSEFSTRSAVVDTLIELAHDLDARGLVLCPAKYVAIAEFLQEGESEVAAGDFTPIDTADAGLETGGE